MISRPVVVSPVKAILAMRRDEASGLPASTPKPLTMLRTPGGSRSPISSISTRIDAGVCSAGLRTTQLPAASAGASFHTAMRMREVPGDDLADHAERLVEVVGHGVVVDLGDRALLGADGAGEVAEVVDGQRQVGVEGLADRLAVVPGLGDREHLEVLLHPVGDLVEDDGALGGGGLAPGGLAACAASRASSMSSASERATSQNGLPVTGETFSKYWPLTGATHSPPMKFS